LQQVLADDDDRVVGIHHCTGERDGKQLSVDCILVFQLKDGRVSEGSEHFGDLYAWDEFWS
jgi:ketosteroid isomerase-like protein